MPSKFAKQKTKKEDKKQENEKREERETQERTFQQLSRTAIHASLNDGDELATHIYNQRAKTGMSILVSERKGSVYSFEQMCGMIMDDDAMSRRNRRHSVNELTRWHMNSMKYVPYSNNMFIAIDCKDCKNRTFTPVFEIVSDYDTDDRLNPKTNNFLYNSHYYGLFF